MATDLSRAGATTIAGIERELDRIWAARDLTTDVDGVRGRHVAARTSVLNLVVVALGPELAARATATLDALPGRPPSRTLVVVPEDPDGPSELRAEIEARCRLPRDAEPEICSETILLRPGGETGRHLASIVAPLLVHDLPVTLWWPGEPPPFGSPLATELLAMADRLVVDGSGWPGDGLAMIRDLAAFQAATGASVSDFALVRQSRWREAIASVFDLPDLLPFLPHVKRIAVSYAATPADERGAPRPGGPPPATANAVKPLYHAAWLASRLDLSVVAPLALRSGSRTPGPVRDATLRGAQGEVRVTLGGVPSRMPPGTTLEIELLAERRGAELRAEVTADAERIVVRAHLDGLTLVDRAFLLPRRREPDLLEEALELGTRDRIGAAALRLAAALVGGGRADG
ncbi:MAG: hypothetical protein RL338_1558 [Chloroflexota bacterium]